MFGLNSSDSLHIWEICDEYGDQTLVFEKMVGGGSGNSDLIKYYYLLY